MLSEEALILLGAAGAIVLVVLGVLELLWPSKPRHPVRRQRATTPEAPPPAMPAAAPPVAPPEPLDARSVFTRPVAPPTAFTPPTAAAPAAKVAPARKRRSRVSPHARPHARGTATPAAAPGGSPAASTGAVPAPPASGEKGRSAEPGAPGVTEAVAVPSAEPRRVVDDAPPIPEPAAPADVVEAAGAAGAPASAEAARLVDPLMVETCFSLYQDRCYDEVILVGEEALRNVRVESLREDDAHELAALWSVVALAKQARGDDEGAREALESALEVAPALERPTYLQHVAALSINAARTLLERAGAQESEDRVGELRLALSWTERGLAAVPADARLRETREQVQEALWPAFEQTVNRLLQRQEFESARRLLREALDDPQLPSAWVGGFRDLLSGTLGGEIGQLTAQAIRSMQEERESEALGSLRRAEELLATIPDEALPPKRREEVDQRLWWGYTRLGMRRVDAGEYEEALDPLVHALRFTDISPDRQAETRATLVRAVEGVADIRALAIRQLTDDGNRDEAVLRTEALHELLRSCLGLGVSEEELSVAFAKTRRLGEELGLPD